MTVDFDFLYNWISLLQKTGKIQIALLHVCRGLLLLLFLIIMMYCTSYKPCGYFVSFFYYIRCIYLLDFNSAFIMALSYGQPGRHANGWMDNDVPLMQVELRASLPSAHMTEWAEAWGLGTPGISNSGWHT